MEDCATGHTQHMIHRLAQEIFGLPPGFTRVQLCQRWRVLARYSHPDRNLCRDAKQIFTLFSICRQVLLTPIVVEAWSVECCHYLWKRLQSLVPISMTGRPARANLHDGPGASLRDGIKFHGQTRKSTGTDNRTGTSWPTGARQFQPRH